MRKSFCDGVPSTQGAPHQALGGCLLLQGTHREWAGRPLWGRGRWERDRMGWEAWVSLPFILCCWPGPKFSAS